MDAATVQIDDRVELSPAYDLWMQGARFGVVKQIHNEFAYVEMDHPQVKRRQKILIADLKLVRRSR